MAIDIWKMWIRSSEMNGAFVLTHEQLTDAQKAAVEVPKPLLPWAPLVPWNVLNKQLAPGMFPSLETLYELLRAVDANEERLEDIRARSPISFDMVVWRDICVIVFLFCAPNSLVGRM